MKNSTNNLLTDYVNSCKFNHDNSPAQTALLVRETFTWNNTVIMPTLSIRHSRFSKIHAITILAS